jgi:short-subunit dehydrogenase
MLRRGGGQVVGVTSLAAKLAKAYRSSYAGSKHAFLGVLDSMRAELVPRGIAITNILPGYIKTNLSKNALTASEGERFGRDDENAAKGMDAGEMARQAVRAIYLRVNEVYIGKEWLPVIALILRNICPDLAFRALVSSAKDTPPASDKRS